jgi:hypothetical protein
MRWVGHVAYVGEKTGVYRVWLEKPEGKRPLGRSRHRLDGNIKMELQEGKWGAWTGSIWLRIRTGGGKL